MFNLNTLSPTSPPSFTKTQTETQNLRFSGGETDEIDSYGPSEFAELLGFEKRLVANHLILGKGVIAQALGETIEKISLTPRAQGIFGYLKLEEKSKTRVGRLPDEEELLKQIFLSIAGAAGESVAYGGPKHITAASTASIKQAKETLSHMIRLGYRPTSEEITDPKGLETAFYKNGLKIGTQILELIPQKVRNRIVDAALGAVELEGDAAKNLITDAVGPDFDWVPLKQLAQSFIDNPTGKVS